MQDVGKAINNSKHLLSIGSILMLAFGFCCACFSLALFFDPAEGDPPYQMSWLLSFIFLALPMIGASIVGMFIAWRRYEQEKKQNLEKTVLLVASQHQGIVTATQIALNSSLSLSEAQDYLEELVARGICRLEINQDGTTYFVFESLQK